MRLNGLLAVNAWIIEGKALLRKKLSTLVLSRLFLYITEIILIATINNFDVEELFVKQNRHPKVINVMKIR
ncbi:hypothetical protein D9Z30_19450 [Escherichia coli]|nr:hypothetical protein [Escherichia coli]EEY0846414.1 hypothetical protein [Escherichia coli]EFN7461778.1 hypothetical protein [Escherichia coli]EFN8735435.1 hypothetical protein [Escherichia coli]CAD5472042.1 hypothetical protein QREC_QR164_01363 [Escherichia coli]